MSEQTFKTFTDGLLVPCYQDYTPEHLIYGDTDSIYMSLEGVFDDSADPEEVTKFADQLGKVTNVNFRKFMQEAFNVPADRAKAIATDREVVSDKSLFLAKKKYCMHVINDEGLVVDKLKTMGVELTRTDTAECVKTMLRTVVEMLMDRVDYAIVRNFVDEFKIEYHKLPAQEIGRPTAIRTLAKYEKVVADAGGDISACTVGHAKAALVYNSRCRPEDEKIRAGDKIVVVYLKDDKYPSIALPRDAEAYPDWVSKLSIDWDKQWETVEKKLNIYLKPVGYDYETRQSEMVSQFITF